MTENTLSKPLQGTLSVPSPFQHWLGHSWKLLAMPLLIFLILPVGAIFIRLPLKELWLSLQTEFTLSALQLSLVTSMTTVIVTILAGTPLAYWLFRRQTRFSRLLDTLLDLPTVLPPAVSGLALLITFGRNGLLGTPLSVLGIHLPFTTLAVILAQTFIAAPLYIRSAMLGFAGVDCELKKAAALDGANRWQIFRYVMLPMSWQALLSGCILTWARALGEFGATIIFAGNLPGRTRTMPLAIFIGFEVDLNAALTLSVILIVVSFILLLILKLFLPTLIEENLENTCGQT